jgi:hypothetical protein
VSDNTIAVLARRAVFLRDAVKRGGIDEASAVEAEHALHVAVMSERMTSPCPVCGSERGYSEPHGPPLRVSTDPDADRRIAERATASYIEQTKPKLCPHGIYHAECPHCYVNLYPEVDAE